MAAKGGELGVAEEVPGLGVEGHDLLPGGDQYPPGGGEAGRPGGLPGDEGRQAPLGHPPAVEGGEVAPGVGGEEATPGGERGRGPLEAREEMAGEAPGPEDHHRRLAGGAASDPEAAAEGDCPGHVIHRQGWRRRPSPVTAWARATAGAPPASPTRATYLPRASGGVAALRPVRTRQRTRPSTGSRP